MIHFPCPTCKLVLQSSTQMAGNKVACPLCGQRILVPTPVRLAAGSQTSPVELPPITNNAAPRANPNLIHDVRTVESSSPRGTRGEGGAATPTRQGPGIATPLISLMLVLSLFAFFGWLVWLFSNSPPAPNPSPQNKDEPASFVEMSPLPLVPEVENFPVETSSSKQSQKPSPPANKNRRSEPPARIEDRPLDLPPPEQSAKAPPKEPQRSGSTNPTQANALGEELLKAAPEQQDELLEKLRQGKGPEYSQALADAIGQLTGKAKTKARHALADRLARFTAKTLLDYLGSENPELRGAAALALGMKDEKEHVRELINMLEDPEPSVVSAVQAALKSLTAAAEKHTQSRTTNPPRTTAPPPMPSPPPPETKPANTDTTASKAKKPTKDEDVPDVALVPPEETSPAVKAILRTNAIALHSRRAEDRIQAAQVLGGLGEDGKPARRLLCAAMLDPVAAVRVAAADSLKNLDPKMHYLAVKLASEEVRNSSDSRRIVDFLNKVQKLEDDGEPLAPLVAFVVNFAVSAGDYRLFTTALTALSHIGQKDLASYRVIASALTNRDALIRAIALRGLPRMKHGKLAVPRILVLLQMDAPANRIAAIETLTALVDDSTEEIIAAAIAAQRYHQNEAVRRAVESALNKLENRQNP